MAPPEPNSPATSGDRTTQVQPEEPPSENYLVQEQLQRMPPLMARGMVYLVLGACLVAVLYASFSTMDVIISARGVIVPRDGYIKVRSPVAGQLQTVRIQLGSPLAEGDPLFVLRRAGAPAARHPVSNPNGDTSPSTPGRNGLVPVRAPRDGVVSRIHLQDVGEVVRGGEVLATMVPRNPSLLVRLTVPNRRINQIEEGMPLKYKVDAFPYRQYGTIGGTVARVAPAAIPQSNGQYVFQVVGGLDRTSITRGGTTQHLRPGMTLTAEFVTGERTLLSFLLENF